MKKFAIGSGLFVALALGVLAALGTWDDGPARDPARDPENLSAHEAEGTNPQRAEFAATEAAGDSSTPEDVPSTPKEDSPSSDALRGQILGPDGRPCIGFRVIFWDQSVETDAEGRFSISARNHPSITIDDQTTTTFGYSDDAPTPESLFLDHDGWTFDHESSATQDKDGTYLLRALPPGSVEIQILDRETGLPVSDYRVDFTAPMFGRGDPRFSIDGTEIDEIGRMFFEKVPSGETHFFVNHEEYVGLSEEIEVRPGRITRTTVFLDRLPSIFGVVTNSHGVPLAEAEVWLNRELQITDPDGVFRFERLRPDSYVFAVLHSDALPLPETSILLEPGEQRDLGEQVLDVGGELSGVLSLASGRFPKWAHVRVEEVPEEVPASSRESSGPDTDGTPAGAGVLELGTTELDDSISRAAGGSSPGVELPAAEQQAALPGKRQRFEKPARYEKATRVYAISGVPPGRYRLVISYGAHGEVFTHRTAPFELARGAPRTLDFILPTD